MSEFKDLFLGIGLNDKVVVETIKNGSLTKALVEVINEAKAEKGCDKEKGKLIYQVATKFPLNNEKIPLENRSFLMAYIRDNKIVNEKQLKFALDFVLTKVKPKEIMNESHKKAFEEASGVGIVVTDEMMNEALTKRFNENLPKLREERYTFNSISIFTTAKKELPWADDKKFKDLFDKKLLDILGPKTKEDEEMMKNKKNIKEAPVKKEEVKKEEVKENVPETTLSDSVTFHRPEENLQPREELLTTHLNSTGKRIVTRFPPEPNGFLHLGHCKAMNLSFNYAKKNDGFCYMRFDDTNPHTEKQEYIDSALENIKWLGHKPYKITYASDYFEQLYEFAVQLIKSDKAYVCHMTGDEIAKSREERSNSPWRNRPIEESLKLFEEMKKGKIAEGKATLRLKMDMSSDNPNMRDLVAYRIKFAPHPHVGDKWCIYPSYDYTHCICDSIENITHSLCTLEFQVRNENYRWLLDAIDIYRSPQIEYSRVNLTFTVLSKRRLIKLVNERHVNGWDDPRMPTINGMRRRGYTAEALNSFCESIGITKSHNVVRLEVLEHEVRSHLNEIAQRGFGVLDPLEIHISNYPTDKVEYFEAPDFPNKENSSKHKIPFSNTVYIEAGDFKEKDFNNFYGLAPGKKIRLRYAYVIECTSFEKDENGKVNKIIAKYIPNDEIEKNPKGVLHWVAKTKDGSSPLVSEVRLYDTLFTEKEPGKKTGNFLDDINPKSLVVKSNCFLDPSFKGAKHFDKFQLERVGYFSVDPDSKNNKLVLNLTVSLKESKERKNLTEN